MELRYQPLIVISIFAFSFQSLNAQDHTDKARRQNYNLNHRTFQVSLFPPLGTNGVDAPNFASKYSFNILAGYNGALANGFELGGLINAQKYYNHGVQIAGLANYSGSETEGVQFAGLGNISRGSMTGIQFSGLVNLSGESLQGLQFSGLANLSGADSQGLQAAGLMNAARTNMQGLYAAGVGNLSGGDMEGLLFGGVFNITKRNMTGIVTSGALNISRNFEGIETAAVNINREFQGIQAGVFNASERGEGLQVGIINYAKNFEGFPVGLISYYKNGRRNLDIWASDAGFTNVGLKLGTQEVYNMISVGYNTLLDRDVWQLGWSIGRLHQYRNHFLYTDFSYFKINEGGWTKDLNSNLKYRLLFGKDFGNGFKLYGGPSFNMLISRAEGHDDYTWYRLFDFGAKGRDYIFWMGLSAGVELI